MKLHQQKQNSKRNKPVELFKLLLGNIYEILKKGDYRFGKGVNQMDTIFQNPNINFLYFFHKSYLNKSKILLRSLKIQL
jgi:hypothetical protein